jgi:hypothetical protein
VEDIKTEDITKGFMKLEHPETLVMSLRAGLMASSVVMRAHQAKIAVLVDTNPEVAKYVDEEVAYLDSMVEQVLGYLDSDLPPCLWDGYEKATLLAKPYEYVLKIGAKVAMADSSTLHRMLWAMKRLSRSLGMFVVASDEFVLDHPAGEKSDPDWRVMVAQYHNALSGAFYP